MIAVGHRTHWKFDFGHAEAASDTPAASFDEPPLQIPRQAGDGNLAGETGAIELTEAACRKWGIELRRVERRALNPVVSANGVVEYAQDAIAEMASSVPGYVFRVFRRVGDPVRKGDVLAIVDAADVGRAKAEFRKAVVSFNEKEHSLARMHSVGSSLPERQLRQAEADCREARIQLVNAQQALMNLGFVLALNDVLTSSDDELIQRVRMLGLPRELIGDIPPLTDNLLPLRAPFDGIVIRRKVVDGEYVDRDRSQFAVANISRMWITLHVRKDQQNLVCVGAPLEFAIEDAAVDLRSTIHWVDTELDPATRTLQVRAEVANPPTRTDLETGIVVQGRLRAGTFGVGRITVGDAAEKLVVPNLAIHFDGDRYFVFVRQENRFRRCNVEIGIGELDVTSVEPVGDAKQILIEGCEVAAEGSHMLKAELQVAEVSY
ncbi:MAG TPA: efflux RND transporter periplasmic adaptor subunit [Pirellulales bacterium]|nr:efflux RND transporter periplasmic adaptor subunit [Pirellulales bacterium]